ncbi:hypothetical protein AAMO2058_001310700 [Amorphochlora amoebiformis]
MGSFRVLIWVCSFTVVVSVVKSVFRSSATTSHPRTSRCKAISRMLSISIERSSIPVSVLSTSRHVATTTRAGQDSGNSNAVQTSKSPEWALKATRCANHASPDGTVVGVMCSFKVKEEHVQEFIAEAITNAKASLQNEPDCLRFDVIQDSKTPTKIAFCEVFRNLEGIEKHKTQDHYKRIKGLLPDMVVDQSRSVWCRNVFPKHPEARWSAQGEAKSVQHPHFAQGSLHVIFIPTPCPTYKRTNEATKI